jgi:hypothetical protein
LEISNMPLNYDPAKEQMPSKLDVGVLFPWMGFVVQSSSNGQRQGSNEWHYGLMKVCQIHCKRTHFK